MTDSKKRRMSMLDTLANAGTPAATPSMMMTNRALRSARDAVDSHRIWELDPEQIADDRKADRLDLTDIADLRASIDRSGKPCRFWSGATRRTPNATCWSTGGAGSRRCALPSVSPRSAP
ncbi:hypothetical protein [Paracoccus cavernae]|uniref:hypothetical protein n=1 Tax=Paracoccus cavernae TaxID=1571207 RepID=UPI00363B6D3B